MRSVTVRLEDLRTMILNLGFVGENEHRMFRFDCKKMFCEYPSASVSLTVQPPAGDCYPAVVERDGDLVSWTVTDSDLIEDGSGELQLTFMVGDVKAKTRIARTKVERSLGAPGQIPTPIENWIEQAEEIISDAEDAATAAWDAADHPPIIDGNGYWNTWDSEEGVYVSTGVKAQGEDGDPGYSPTATVTKSGKVATISITDQNGTTTATVSDGEDGSSAIDDTSTAANKTWSAQKVSGEFSSLLTEIMNSESDIGEIKNAGRLLTKPVKSALLNLFSHVVFTDGHGVEYIEALSDAMKPDAVLDSITAVFEQGSAEITPENTLDDLKNYLTVVGTYEYSGGEYEEEETEYVLSGTLVVGTSTITVTVGEETTTFTVIVTSAGLDLDIITGQHEYNTGYVAYAPYAKRAVTNPYAIPLEDGKKYIFSLGSLFSTYSMAIGMYEVSEPITDPYVVEGTYKVITNHMTRMVPSGWKTEPYTVIGSNYDYCFITFDKSGATFTSEDLEAIKNALTVTIEEDE